MVDCFFNVWLCIDPEFHMLPDRERIQWLVIVMLTILGTTSAFVCIVWFTLDIATKLFRG